MSEKKESHLVRNLRRAPGSAALKLKKWYYKHIFTPLKIRSIRRKERIRVVFVIANLSCWKTESLYKAMLNHDRFEPILLLMSFPDKPDFDNIESYFRAKGYPYERIPDDKTICETLHPDIIFYQQPYERLHAPKHMYRSNMQSLFCYATYSLRSSLDILNTHIKFIRLCWQVYYENEQNLQTYRSLNRKYAANGLATGLPVMDDLLQPRSAYPDPWKPSEGKKRIIFAPHHSVDDNPGFQTSTFLTTGPLMLEIAERYSDKVQWTFKPHPFLRGKLEKIWGKEATDKYYSRWAEAEWSQYEHGEYMGLFKHSDAMIHDCGSFTMEYLATGNPVMYLKDNSPAAQKYNNTHLRALNVHYQGTSPELIERFINQVISENDPLRPGRNAFITEYLTPMPPSACDNIIAAILGEQ